MIRHVTFGYLIHDELLFDLTVKRSKLFANYTHQSSSRQASGSTLQQVQRYLDMDDIETDCLAFWHKSKTSLDKLHLPEMRALSVTASSAAVERVFSQGGLIMRPHTARLCDKVVSQLIFLRCNTDSSD